MLKVGTKRTLNGYNQVNSPVKPVNPAAIPDGSITYDKLSEDVQTIIEAVGEYSIILEDLTYLELDELLDL